MCKEASDLGLHWSGSALCTRRDISCSGLPATAGRKRSTSSSISTKPRSSKALNADGKPLHIEVELADRSIAVAVWEVKVGRTRVYLLDTDVETNSLLDRSLSARLYTADREQRIQQEVVLGIGGVRAMRALSIEPSIWHANEGHAAFMAIERVREEVKRGVPFGEALNKIRKNAIFTTHTPVPAGHDVFSDDTVQQYLHAYWNSLEMPRRAFP